MSDFSDMFRDPRWLERKEELLEAAGRLCEDCGPDASDTDDVDVHVCYYPKNKSVWQFPTQALKVLCKSHMAKRQRFERELRKTAAFLSTADLGLLVDALEKVGELSPLDRSRAMEAVRPAVKRATDTKWSGPDA